MKIACIAPFVAYEGIDHAGGLYLEQYLAGLQSLGHDVRLFAPSTHDNIEALASNPTAPTWLGPAPPNGRIRRGTQFLTSGAGANAVRGPVFLAGLDPKAQSWLSGADVIDVQWYDCLIFAPMLRRKLTNAVIVGTAHDVLTQSVGRARTLSPSRAARVKSRVKLPLVRMWERRALNALDHIHVFKDSDVGFLKNMGVRTPTSVTVPVIETFDLPTASTALTGTPTVVFVAAFARPENDEAARWLVEQVIPKVRAEFKDVRFRFAGSHPPDWLVQLRAADLEITGYLPSMRPAYAGATCVVVPLRRGAGLKFKTVQAMGLGIPVVSTHIGAEGIRDLCGLEPRTVTDDPDEFAAGICDALKSGSKELRLLESNAAIIRSRLDFNRQVKTQVKTFQSLMPTAAH